MDEFTASRTALGVALMRAEHTRRDPEPVIVDAWADRLVPDDARATYRRIALAGMDEADRAQALSPASSGSEDLLARHFRGQPLYGNILLRQRWAEDALAAAVAEGTRQYVIIGAGFDSFALRRPAWARDLDIIEIDHPATQGLKVQQMARAGVAAPEGWRLVAADLSREDLASALTRSSYRVGEPAFFAWLGVTVYLTREANLTTMASVAAISAPTSRLAFTYADQAMFERRGGAAAEGDTLRRSSEIVARLGEPFVSGFHPADLAGDLASVGLDLIEDLAGPQLAARYGRTGALALPTSATSHCALARVR